MLKVFKVYKVLQVLKEQLVHKELLVHKVLQVIQVGARRGLTRTLSALARGITYHLASARVLSVVQVVGSLRERTSITTGARIAALFPAIAGPRARGETLVFLHAS